MASAAASAAFPLPQLSVMTFNVLCPAYKRCNTDAPSVFALAAAGEAAASLRPSSKVQESPSPSPPPAAASSAAIAANGPAVPPASPFSPSGTGAGHRYRESSSAPEWTLRVRLMLRCLAEADADVVALQEWWGASEEFRSLVSTAPELKRYHFVCAQRTGGKDDGIAILLKRSWIHRATTATPGVDACAASPAYEMSLSSLARHDIHLTGFGNRIGLALHLQCVAKPLDAVAAAAAEASAAASHTAHASHAAFAASNALLAQLPGYQHHPWRWQDHMQQTIASAAAVDAAAAAAMAGCVTAAASPSSAASSPVAAASRVPRIANFWLIVTHLTFPHSVFDLQQRKLEICCLLCAMDDFRYKGPAAAAASAAASAAAASSPCGCSPLPLCSLPVLLAGDFNTALDCKSDFVYAKITSRGFVSSFAATNGDREPAVTHRNHRKENVPVDFIFFRQGSKTPAEKAAEREAALKSKGTPTSNGNGAGAGGIAACAGELPASASVDSASASSPSPSPPAAALPSLHPVYSTLLPVSLPDSSWPDAPHFPLSDHRPLLSVFEMRGWPESTAQQAAATAVKQTRADGIATAASANSDDSAASAATSSSATSQSVSAHQPTSTNGGRVALSALSSTVSQLSQACSRLFAPTPKAEPEQPTPVGPVPESTPSPAA